MTEPAPIARVKFTDGEVRDVWEDPAGGQYVLGAYGQRLYGMRFIPRDDADTPIVVNVGATRAGKVKK